MYMQLDWVGELKETAFRDIRNQRPSTAEEKAQLLKILGELMNKVPDRIRSGGSIEEVRRWKLERGEVAKVAGNRRSSTHDIRSAINKMQKYFDAA
jgi:hypothetical protein